jgi:mycothiol synthase
MEHASTAFVVAPARPEERAAALHAFFHHLDDDDRAARVERVVQMLAQDELDADGLLACRADEAMAGAIVAAVLPGASGLIWPPRALPGPHQPIVENLLAQGATRWLRQRGCRFAQALLSPVEAPLGQLLERNGFNHITDLLYMKSELGDRGWLTPDEPAALTYQNYHDGCERELFHATLLASYEDTLDCPELNDVRSAAEIIAGYRGMDGCDPRRWWLAWHQGRPVAVLILTEHASANTWDLTYLGVVASARGRGVGRTLTSKTLREAQAAGAIQVTLTMDLRNEPARRLYNSFGFTLYDRRQVYLALLG